MKNLYILVLFALSAFVVNAQRSPVAVNDTASIYENGTILLNVLANDSNFNPQDSVCLTSVWSRYTGWAVIQGCSKVKFHPLNASFVGLDTFYYRSADQQFPSLFDTGMVIVNVKILAPKAFPDFEVLINGQIDSMRVLVNDSNYNLSDSIRITNIWGAPAGWASVLDSTQIVVQALNPRYYGVVNINYRACDWRIPTLCDTGLLVVSVVRTPKAYKDIAALTQPDTAFLPVIPDTVYINVTANDSDLNVFDSTCVTTIWGVDSTWASIWDCGQIAYYPDSFHYAGRDTFYYSACYTETQTLCDTAMVIVIVTLPKPAVDFTWYEDTPCVAQVYNNSALADSVIWTVHYLTPGGNNQTLTNVNQLFLTSNTADSGFQVQVCLQAFNPQGDTSVCYTFWVQCTITNGIADIGTSHLAVYPDPASDRIQLDFSKTDPGIINEASFIVIYDMTGRELESIPISEKGNAIAVGNLSPGIYLIGLLDNNQNKKLLSKFEVIH